MHLEVDMEELLLDHKLEAWTLESDKAGSIRAGGGLGVGGGF